MTFIPYENAKTDERTGLITENNCSVCDGTGEVEKYYFDNDSKNWYVDGGKPCLCQIGEPTYD
jgi:hypothetical protein